MTTTKFPPAKEDDKQKALNSYLETEEAQALMNRFQAEFDGFMQSQKNRLLLEVLREEIPELAQDETFKNKVLKRLDNTIIEEQPFVFLVVNSKFQFNCTK